MPGMGPAPKPVEQRRRRNAVPGTVHLPAEGRAGKPAPRWPLIPDIAIKAKLELAESRLLKEQCRDKPDERKVERYEEQVAIAGAQLRHQRRLEADVWRSVWRMPQAVEWERTDSHREVAQYVRWKVMAELGNLDAGREARQYADRLGLTPMALLRLRWQIDGAGEARPGGHLASVATIGSSSTSRPPVRDE